MEQRKHPRLKHYDYSGNGAYFVTFCTKNRRCLLGETVGRDDHGAPALQLTGYGRIVEGYIRSIPAAYPNVTLSNYAVMPNHVHLLLLVSEDGAPGSSRPTDTATRPMPRATQLIPRIVAAVKRFSNREVGFDLWQPSFHDHIVRSEQDFLDIWNYITGNPSKWSDDIYYEP